MAFHGSQAAEFRASSVGSLLGAPAVRNRELQSGCMPKVSCAAGIGDLPSSGECAWKNNSMLFVFFFCVKAYLCLYICIYIYVYICIYIYHMRHMYMYVYIYVYRSMRACGLFENTLSVRRETNRKTGTILGVCSPLDFRHIPTWVHLILAPAPAQKNRRTRSCHSSEAGNQRTRIQKYGLCVQAVRQLNCTAVADAPARPEPHM